MALPCPSATGSLILAADPDEVGRLQIEARIRLTFQPVALHAGLLNDVLRARLIAPERQRKGRHQAHQREYCASNDHPASHIYAAIPFTMACPHGDED